MQEKIIEVVDVNLTYKRRLGLFSKDTYVALDGLSFDIFKGEVLGIIGRNGVGKSSLLKLLSGILRPDKGEVIHHTNKISLMALQAGFDPNLAGRENIIMSAMLLGYEKSQIKKMMPEIHKFSELGDFFFKPVRTYSAGMKARLGFSLAMYLSPDVLLVDEVLGVGDVSFRKKANEAIEHKLSSDMTVVIVSHSEGQIRKLAERVIWIDGGKVRSTGNPEYVFPQYNLALALSNQKLVLTTWIKDENYDVRIEQVRQSSDTYSCNFFIVSKNNEEIIEPYILAVGNKSNLKSIEDTMAMKKVYPDNPHISKSKFFAQDINLNAMNELFVNCNNESKKVLSYRFEKLGNK